jgi:2-oxoisovalerate dehydrogenase E1 component alpha subunit
LIESNVVRLTPHSSDDDDRRYRPESDREEARHHDPIDVFGSNLRAHGVLDEGSERAMREQIQGEVESALEEAEAAAPPNPESAFDNVYAGVRVADLRSRWSLPLAAARGLTP